MRAIALQRLGLLRRDTKAERLVLTTPAMLALTVAGACLTGLTAQFRLYLPGAPVPITGQVFAVLICGAFLGAGYGALSQVLYVGAGVLGVPWFSMGAFGAAYLAGPTGGYLIGFAVAAAFLGLATRRLQLGRSYAGLVALMSIAVGIIYLFGSAHLMTFLRTSFAEAFSLNIAMFMAVDLLKVLVAARIVTAVRSL
jgi:biotin transport system substrate-specific component